ncbi:MAG: hypothetical protein GY787_13710 [Alteromonadales bacterium]|nr:hypothetical protein [Alteromonadales bacterium]
MRDWHVDLRLLKAEHVSGYCIFRSSEPDGSEFIAKGLHDAELFEEGVRAYLNTYSQNVVFSLIDKLGLDIHSAVIRINQYLKVTEIIGQVSKPSNDSLAMKIRSEGVPQLLSADKLRMFLKPENVCPFWVSMSLRASVNTKVSKTYAFEVLSKK